MSGRRRRGPSEGPPDPSLSLPLCSRLGFRTLFRLHFIYAIIYFNLNISAIMCGQEGMPGRLCHDAPTPLLGPSPPLRSLWRRLLSACFLHCCDGGPRGSFFFSLFAPAKGASAREGSPGSARSFFSSNSTYSLRKSPRFKTHAKGSDLHTLQISFFLFYILTLLLQGSSSLHAFPNIRFPITTRT
jgi:hypothetical protein